MSDAAASPVSSESARPSRARRWRRWLLAASGLLLLFALVLISWLCLSQSGLRWLWSQLERRPELAGVELNGLGGSLLGPIEFESLVWQAESGRLQIDGGELVWSPSALWSDSLQIDQLSLDQIHWQPAVQAEAKPGEPMALSDQLGWQWPLPELPINIDLRLLQIRLAQLQAAKATYAPAARRNAENQHAELGLENTQVDRAGAELRALRLSAHYSKAAQLELRELSLETPWVTLLGVQGAGTAAEPWRFELQPEAQNDVRWQLSLQADRQALRIGLNDASDSLKLTLNWSRQALTLQLQAEQADLRPYLPGLPAPLSAQLELNSDFQQLEMQGQWTGHPLAVEQLKARISWAEDFSALNLELLDWQFAQGGEGRLSGVWHIAQPESPLQLDWSLRGLPLAQWMPAAEGMADDAAPRLIRAEGQLSGPIERLLATGSADLMAAERELSVAWEIQAEPERLALQRLDLLTPNGQAQASGSLALGERPQLALDFEAAGLDPYWLLPHWQGSLDFGGKLDVQQRADGLTGEVRVEQLAGQINGQSLQGELHLALVQGQVTAVNADLRAGSGRLELRSLTSSADNSPARAAQAARLTLQEWRLDPWWPGLRGTLRGELLIGDLPALVAEPPALWRDIQLDIKASQLQFDGLALAELGLKGSWPGPGAEAGELALRWQGLDADKQGKWSGEALLSGRPERYQLTLSGARDNLQLSLAAEGEHGPTQRSLRLSALALNSTQAGSWTLQAPAKLDYTKEASLSPACLHGDIGDLCLQVQQTAAGRDWQLQGRALDLGRILNLLRPTEALQLSGELALDLAVREQNGAWRPLNLHVEGGPGELRSLEQDAELLRWDRLQVDGAEAAASDQVWRASGRLFSPGDGLIEAEIELPLQDLPQWQAMRARLSIDLQQIAALQLLLPDVVNARGQAKGELRWSPEETPAISGELRLAALAGKLPALGIEFADSELTVFGSGDSLQIDGQLRSGGGPLLIEGQWQPDGLGRMRLSGQAVRLADTRRLKIVASPDLALTWQAGALKLSGKVDVVDALIDLERLEAGETRSADVVVLDPRFEAEGMQALPLNADLQLKLSNEVRLHGFGFDGSIAGQLRISERPGEATRGRGSLNLSGNYRAYGQDLEIERGRLLFANGPLDNPGIDLRAMRKVRRDKVGIEVRGPARSPRLSLWSEPAMNQAEALSLLVLGQPLSSASSADGAQLGQAAAAMGGNLLAAKVGGRLGLDTFGVADSSSIGAAFTVGKYLSPRLYLAYGVALFEDASAVTVRYLINDRLDLEIESSRESRAGINYRVERD